MEKGCEVDAENRQRAWKVMAVLEGVGGHGLSRNTSRQQGNKSTARVYCREHLAKSRDGGKKLTSSGWILSYFQIKIYSRLGAMSWTESNDPAHPSQLCTLFYITPEFPFPALPGTACRGCA